MQNNYNEKELKRTYIWVPDKKTNHENKDKSNKQANYQTNKQTKLKKWRRLGLNELDILFAVIKNNTRCSRH